MIDLLALQKYFILQHLGEGDVAVDFTMGNGHDTEFLSKTVGENGHVFAFDIQEKAIENTRNCLQKLGLSGQAEVIKDSHTNMGQYVEEESVSCIVFNFGYLPGGDHALATHKDTSIAAIYAGLDLLKKGGMMSLCIYSGGDSGFEERDAILEELKNLDSKRYLVIMSSYYNRPNNPPIPVFIMKV